MAISIREEFEVQAPIDEVWRFLMDPHRVVTCMPGAQLEEVVDERSFLGNIKVKVGPITTSYKGRVHFTAVDETNHTMEMTAEGREVGSSGGGMAKGTMASQLRVLSDDLTAVTATANVDVTGRIMQFGRGMIQGVSHELFQQFAASAKRQLENSSASAEALSETEKASATKPINAIGLFFRVIGSAVSNLFRRILRRNA